MRTLDAWLLLSRQEHAYVNKPSRLSGALEEVEKEKHSGVDQAKGSSWEHKVDAGQCLPGVGMDGDQYGIMPMTFTAFL